MIVLRTGPLLKRQLERELRCYASYKYTDAAGKTVPEYDATHIQVRCYYITMGPALVPQLAGLLATQRGCVSTEQILTHKTLRPQVVALFDRSLA